MSIFYVILLKILNIICGTCRASAFNMVSSTISLSFFITCTWYNKWFKRAVGQHIIVENFYSKLISLCLKCPERNKNRNYQSSSVIVHHLPYKLSKRERLESFAMFIVLTLKIILSHRSTKPTADGFHIFRYFSFFKFKIDFILSAEASKI